MYMVSLMEYVRQLEHRDNRARGDYVLQTLDSMGITPLIQERRWPAIRNIVVDLAPQGKADKRLFCAHYDTIRGSSGANDNASSVAVLLELCRWLKQTSASIRVVFLDREEGVSAKPVLRMGLLGSLYYVWSGQGDCLAIWPVNHRGDSAAAGEVEKAAKRLSVSWRWLDIPWALQTSDHLPFRLTGFKNVISLSILPSDQMMLLDESLNGVSTASLLAGHLLNLPEPFSLFHTKNDTSVHLSEGPLVTMLSLVLELATGKLSSDS
jgi:hypothetical protein